MEDDVDGAFALLIVAECGARPYASDELIAVRPMGWFVLVWTIAPKALEGVVELCSDIVAFLGAELIAEFLKDDGGCRFGSAHVAPKQARYIMQKCLLIHGVLLTTISSNREATRC